MTRPLRSVCLTTTPTFFDPLPGQTFARSLAESWSLRFAYSVPYEDLKVTRK